MQEPSSDITVGDVTLEYNHQLRGWNCGGRVIKNPLTVQRIAERLHTRNTNLEGQQDEQR
ncbi:DUF1317 family protein [Pantoea sp. At-9b]|uniref:DUF1317 family protein n=1 Tax=Pantoea sp. (strain At-9b) TaxID=592316 RepID=UPI0001B3E1F8|nr:DUF1317 family protein [Pantoea sp. At-9b]ADU71518.1 protein of unknown function DUF1317 [Pantoea sp. At-9b]